MASQEEEGINAQEKTSVELQNEEYCGLQFERVLLLDLLLPEGRF